MKPVRALACLASSAAVLATACGESDRPAATIDGTEISQQQVVDELEAIRGNGPYLEAVEQAQPVVGQSEGSFDAAFVAGVLTNQIQFTLVFNEVERRALDAPDECRAAVRADLVDRMAQASATGDGEGVLDSFPEAYRSTLVDRDTSVRVLQADLAGLSCDERAAAEAYYDDHRPDFEQLCLSHILLETADDAADVQADLAEGADFATVAQSESIDTQSAAQGGDVGCQLIGQLPTELASLLGATQTGLVAGPIETGGGFSLILVRSREVPDLDEIRDVVEQQVASSIADSFRAWLFEALDGADVTVDPRYGEWNPTSGEVERNPSSSATLPSTTAPPAADE
ncbi:MAG: peptidylprolyl isomerase [Acidimicrobiales bacterium]